MAAADFGFGFFGFFGDFGDLGDRGALGVLAALGVRGLEDLGLGVRGVPVPRGALGLGVLTDAGALAAMVS